MSFIKRNMWSIGFVVILVGAFVAMWASSTGSDFPSPNANTKDAVEFIITNNDHVKGATNAKVTIVEFSDFQCPACKSYAPVLNELVKIFPNDVRLVYKHFPLRSIHLRAQGAAEAAEAASLQGKFWEMVDKLFSGQEIWSKGKGSDQFEAYAKEFGLDTLKFKNDLASNEVKNAVNDDYKEGLDIGINSTPTFYLNGKKIVNPDSLEAFKALIETELKASQE